VVINRVVFSFKALRFEWQLQVQFFGIPGTTWRGLFCAIC